MEDITYRCVNPDTDTSAILEIYRPFVLSTVVTFEYDVPTVDEFWKRICKIKDEYPYIVAEQNNKIIGYAYAHRYQERCAYQWNVELSIYLAPEARRKKIGKKMYEILFEILACMGIRNGYALITHPYPESEEFHKAMGFQELGCYHKTGYKSGKWHDVVLMEKEILSHSLEPEPVKPFASLPKEKIEEILRKGSDK